MTTEAGETRRWTDRHKAPTEPSAVDASSGEDDGAALTDDGAAEIDWSTADIVFPIEKTAISIRVDRDVLDFFRDAGPGYQTRINAVLRSYMDQRRRTAG